MYNSKSAYPNDAAQQILNHFYFLPLALLVFPLYTPSNYRGSTHLHKSEYPFQWTLFCLIWLSSFAEETDKVLSQVI